MSPRRVQIAIPAGTATYWSALLQRSGLPVRELDDSVTTGTMLFLPDAAGCGSRAMRQSVASHRRRGVPVLAGTAWGRCLDLPPDGASRSVATGLALRMPLPSAASLLRESARLVPIAGSCDREVAEIVATVDHGRLRRDIEAALRSLAFAAGLPFVRLAHAPVGCDGALVVRIDADGHRAASTEHTLAELANARLRATWFIDVERHLGNGGMPSLARIAACGHELQSHGFRHYTYRSAARNERNLRRSVEVLAAHGQPVDAVASPFGTWNRGLATALRACGMTWSSEFARVYDDVPGSLGGSIDEPWQVPVHPVCPALLLAAGATVAEVHGWFRSVLMQCLQRGEPAVVYGHPIDDLERCPGLLQDLHETALCHVPRLWQPTMGELHAFYRQRAAQPCEVELAGDDVVGVVSGPAPLLVERRGRPTVAVHGGFRLPPQPTLLVPTTIPMPMAAPVPYRAAPRAGERLRTGRLRLARLLRELRR